MKMLVMRVVNILATIPFIICLFFLFLFIFYLANRQMFLFEETGIGGLIKVMVFTFWIIVGGLGVSGVIASFCYAFLVIVTGNGIIWRKVERHNFLLNKEGRTVHVFNKSELIYRFDPIFKGNELR